MAQGPGFDPDEGAGRRAASNSSKVTSFPIKVNLDKGADAEFKNREYTEFRRNRSNNVFWSDLRSSNEPVKVS
jgi:hypothetical protein